MSDQSVEYSVLNMGNLGDEVGWMVVRTVYRRVAGQEFRESLDKSFGTFDTRAKAVGFVNSQVQADYAQADLVYRNGGWEVAS